MSTVAPSIATPYDEARPIRSATLALRMTFLLGRQAMFGHDPPTSARSITTTARPCWARSHAMYLPASPPPRTTFSMCTVSVMVRLSESTCSVPVYLRSSSGILNPEHGYIQAQIAGGPPRRRRLQDVEEGCRDKSAGPNKVVCIRVGRTAGPDSVCYGRAVAPEN